jgi:hypothetical protein
MELREAKLERKLSNDWIHGTNHIVEVEMSYTQFVEAITSQNGDGVPVTIKWLRGVGRIEQVPFVNKRTQFQAEFKRTMNAVTNGLGALEQMAREVLAAKAPTKAEREALLKKIQQVAMNIRDNMPFVLSQFNEQMDKTVMEAKGEFEALISTTVHRLGLAELQANPSLLSLPGGDGAEHKEDTPDGEA